MYSLIIEKNVWLVKRRNAGKIVGFPSQKALPAFARKTSPGHAGRLLGSKQTKDVTKVVTPFAEQRNHTGLRRMEVRHAARSGGRNQLVVLPGI